MKPVKSNLPADWKWSIKSQHSTPAYLNVVPHWLDKWLEKPEIKEATELLWKITKPEQGKRTPVFGIMHLLLLGVRIAKWPLYGMQKRTKAEWNRLADAMETIMKDRREFFFPGEGDGIELPDLAEAILYYRRQAEGASNSREKNLEARSVLGEIYRVFRQYRLRPSPKFNSLLMTAAFGPTWTEVYTSARASKWGITKKE
jgi:hypothetical protein